MIVISNGPLLDDDGRRLLMEEQDFERPIDLYLHLSGGRSVDDVPAELVAAEERFEKKIHEEDKDSSGLIDKEEVEHEPERNDEKEVERCESGKGFCSSYLSTRGPYPVKCKFTNTPGEKVFSLLCPRGEFCSYDWARCYERMRTAQATKDSAYRLVSRLHNRGQSPVCHKLQKRTGWAWNRRWMTTMSACVPVGYWSKIQRYGIHRERKAEVYDVQTGDLYNWFVYNYG